MKVNKINMGILMVKKFTKYFSATGVSLELIYKCLNRTVLFQLSRPIDSVSCQTSVLEALHVITNSRHLVFGPGNHDPEFLGCLCYCLLQLTEDPEARLVCACDRLFSPFSPNHHYHLHLHHNYHLHNHCPPPPSSSSP